MGTLTRHSWTHYTVCWFVKKVDQVVLLLQQSIEHMFIVHTC